MTDEIQTRGAPGTGPFKAKATCASCGREWIAPGAAQSPDTRVREALEAVVSVSQSGADTVSFLVELQRVAKLCASALASGASNADTSTVRVSKTCPNCHDANSCDDYEGPTCEVCLGDGFVLDDAKPWMRHLTPKDQERLSAKVSDYIDRENVFGDHFSENEMKQIATLLSRSWANPVSQTHTTCIDEMIETACAAYAKATNYYVEFHRGLSSPSADSMRKGMRAALDAVSLHHSVGDDK